ALILTKPLGTGIISFASQIGRAPAASIQAAIRSMTTLNKQAAELMIEASAHAATDVTGFSLMGHLAEMASRSAVDVEITWDKLPWIEGVLECAANGILPGGIERNKESCGQAVVAGTGVSETMADICFDPQTSGGLLIAVAPEKADGLIDKLHAADQAFASVIGYVKSKGTGRILLETDHSRTMPEPVSNACCSGTATSKEPNAAEPQPADACCCADTVSTGTTDISQVRQIEANFTNFLASAGRPGGLDAVTKQALNIALSVATRCKPCLKIHIEKARQKGFTEEEIDEAAWMAIAFSGSPAMMFYKENKV
ncbi:MAG: selenide, water dikinase SelD, partial [Verrucomicrobia bacterium]|nr:selenide, water dikinase SelD [Verrucomicrobiota bacterium]